MNEEKMLGVRLVILFTVSKRFLIFLFFISLSTEVFSEEYICSISYDREVQTNTYERKGTYFISTHRFGFQKRIDILKETDQMLFRYTVGEDSVFINIIDKVNKKFSHNYIVLGVDETTGQEGVCLIRD